MPKETWNYDFTIEELRMAKNHLQSIINKNPKLRAKILSWINPYMSAAEADLYAMAKKSYMTGASYVPVSQAVKRDLNRVLGEEV